MAPGPPPPAPGGPKPRNPSARKPSPPRPDGSNAEKTFQQKLDEIKRLRANTSTTPAPLPELRRVIVNGKPSLAISGDWALFASSSGRQYYFNLKSLVNQWHRPPEWCDAATGNAKGNGAKATPPLPPQSSSGNNRPPPPPQPTQPAVEASNGSGHPATFKMKIKSKSKHKIKENLALNKLDDEEAVQENGETNRLPPGALYEEVDRAVSPKRSRRDSSRSYSSRSRSHSRSSRSHSRSSRSSYSSRSSRSSR